MARDDLDPAWPLIETVVSICDQRSLRGDREYHGEPSTQMAPPKELPCPGVTDADRRVGLPGHEVVHGSRRERHDGYGSHENRCTSQAAHARKHT